MGRLFHGMASLDGLNVLLKAPGKETVARLIKEAFRHRIEGVPGCVVAAAADELSCTTTEATAMYAAALHLIRAALYESLESQQVLDLFSEGFHPDLAKLVTKAIVGQMAEFHNT